MRVLAKLGVAWRPGSWQLGANLTAPGFKVYSNGKTNFNATAASGTGVKLLAATTQKGLEASLSRALVGRGGRDAPFRARRPHDGRVVLGHRALRHPDSSARRPWRASAQTIPL